jgi:hypothetical protein
MAQMEVIARLSIAISTSASLAKQVCTFVPTASAIASTVALNRELNPMAALNVTVHRIRLHEVVQTVDHGLPLALRADDHAIDSDPGGCRLPAPLRRISLEIDKQP